MRNTPLLVVAAFITLGAARGDELPKIDRAIAKEPKYEHVPKYFLLVFGPECKTRVWCVLDGNETLYVDRNHDGDLTEVHEHYTPNEDGQILVGDITETGGKPTHRSLTILPPAKNSKDSRASIRVWIWINGVYAAATQVELDERTARPQDAPVRHFRGPLSIFLFDDEKPKLLRGKKHHMLNLAIGTFNPGRRDIARKEGVFVYHDETGQGVPSDVHPQVDIVFPPGATDAEPVVRKTSLMHRC